MALWHLLSLDAPCVAALWLVLFAQVFQVPLPHSAVAALFVAVWMLYAADRLSDAAAMPAHAARTPLDADTLQERHHFHHRHRAALLRVLIGCVLPMVVLLAMLPAALRTGWLLLTVPLALYLSAVHCLRWPRLPKEAAVAIFFAAAIALPDLRLPHAAGRTGATLATAVLFAVVCWLNCVAIARWERSTGSPVRWSTEHLSALFAAALLLCTVLVWLVPVAAPLTLACAVAVALLAMLDRYGSGQQPVLRRSLADAALLTPLPLLVAHMLLHR